MAQLKSARNRRIKDFLEKNEYYIFIVLMTIVAITFLVFYIILEGGPTHDGP